MINQFAISFDTVFSSVYRLLTFRRASISASLLGVFLAIMLPESSWADVFDAMNSNYSNTRMTYRSMLKKCGYSAEQLNNMHLSNNEMLALIKQGCQRGSEQKEQSISSESQWRIRIFDTLGLNQISETATITIGNITQTINIHSSAPTDYVQFFCKNGQWPFTVQTKSSLYNQQAQVVSINGQSDGTLNCYGNLDVDLMLDYSVNPASVKFRSR